MARRLEDKLTALRLLADTASVPDLDARLKVVLRGRSGPLVDLAARIIGDRGLGAHRAGLLRAWSTLSEDGARRDPGCTGKLSCLTALDRLEHMDVDLFIEATRMVQLEKAWGPPVDTAVPVRARAALALSRFSEPEAAVAVGSLICDPAESVRRAAVEAIAVREDPRGAGMLAVRWQLDDPEAPVAQLECGVALARLSPQVGVSLVAAALQSPREDLRELAALALAESRSPAGLEALWCALQTTVTAEGRRLLISALGAHRSEAAQHHLLDLLVDGDDRDAEQALSVLGAQVLSEKMRRLVTLEANERGLRFPEG